MIKTGIWAAAAILLNACAVLKPGLVGEEEFQTKSTEMKVGGRTGWTFNKVVKFGSFRTGKFSLGKIDIDRDGTGWPSIKSSSNSHARAESKFAFQQYDSSGNSVKVKCKIVREEHKVKFGKSLSSTETLLDQYEVGIFEGDSGQTVYFPVEDAPSRMSMGKDTFLIVEESRWDKPNRRVFEGVLFKRNAETVAAIDFSGDGTVWMRNDLEVGKKLILAAVATAFLVKPDLSGIEDE